VKKVEALIRPEKLQAVQDALDALGTSGLTVTEVLGCGAQRGYTETYRGARVNISLQRKVKVEAVVGESLVNAVVDAIAGAARTGEVGDGKIFVVPVDDAIRIRTGERGDVIVRHLEPERWGH
jgi:nitrogen regulatory protein P-II 1